MALNEGASSEPPGSEPPGSETIEDAQSRREVVLTSVVHRSTASPSTVTTPISAIRFSAGLSPVVSTSTMARRVKASKFTCYVLRPEGHIIERTFDSVQTGPWAGWRSEWQRRSD